jgi:trehalose 6-phosphate synthase/phosphatase
VHGNIKRLVIASNRLPIILERIEGKWQLKPGSGGLVTAMAPVLRNRGGLWIGWPGTQVYEDIQKPMSIASRNAGYSMKPILLNQDKVDLYYRGMANEVIWPLFHDLQSYCNFDPAYWRAYSNVNEKFAKVISDSTGSEDFIWVHDYHLMKVAQELRRLNVQSKTGFFLHTPFPPLDIFLKLPWRLQLLRALLAYDMIGFQTLRDRRNFVNCLRTLTKGIRTKGKGLVQRLKLGDRNIHVGSFPISIDFNEFSNLAKSKEVADHAWYIHEDLSNFKIILGIDRLDYTKGILNRIKAFRNALQRYPQIRHKVTLIQVVVPSRRTIPMYQELKTSIERLISEVNGQFTSSGWVPIHYIHRSLTKTELLAYYRTAEIALITPLKDGMNLVAKEYCASNVDGKGALILSEFAGAASELHKNAILVNPYNIEEVADAIYFAYKMKNKERKVRMKKLRRRIRRHDIYWWVNSYLQAAFSGKLDQFPLIDEYIPSLNSLHSIKLK